MRTYKNKSQLLLVVLAVGFFLGILYQNIVSKTQVIETDLFLKSNLQQYLQVDIITEKYLWYVIKERVLLFGVLLMLGCVRWKRALATISLGVIGFILGMLMVSAVLQLGIQGILFCLVGLFPHGLLYGVGFSVLLIYWFQFPRVTWTVAKTFFFVSLIAIGILLEVYLNPIFVRWIIPIL